MLLLLQILKNKDARYLILLSALLSSLLFYRNQNVVLKLQLAQKPNLSSHKEVKRVQAPSKITRKFVDGKKVEELIEKGAITSDSLIDSKLEYKYVYKSDFRWIIGVSADPVARRLDLGRMGFSVWNKLDFTVGSNFKDKVLTEFNVRF